MTYDELKSAIIDFPDLEGEEEITSNVALIIKLAEADIATRLRLMRNLKATALNVSDGEAALPADYLEAYYVRDANGDPVEQLSLEGVDSDPQCGGYVIDGNSIRVSNLETDEILLRYFSRLPALSDVNQSNWLIDLAPDLYLYGSLVHAAVFSKIPDTDLSRYKGQYMDAVSRVLEHDFKTMFASGDVLVARIGR